MNNSQEKIIVFRAYDTVVEANLAKTKLDAYGIPCFLTDENLTTLYPLRNGIFPGVRLHIFENDTAQAEELLGDNTSSKSIICPNCGSNQWEPTSAWRKIYGGLLVLLELHSSPKEYRCRNCNSFFG